jgi:predicted metal-dependent hydrolase
MHLINLDGNLIDYVILHELCHTVEKNHSARFWALVEKHMPDYKERRKKLKNVIL